MKILRGSIGAVGALVGGSIQAVALLFGGSSQGSVVSDDTAANLRGGCIGIQNADCDMGEVCSAGSDNERYDDCNDGSYLYNGLKTYCNGKQSCGNCYTDGDTTDSQCSC